MLVYDLLSNIQEIYHMSQIAIFLFWIFLPCTVLAVSVTSYFHFRSKKIMQNLFSSSEASRITKLEKELEHYKKAYNKLLCKYHSLQKEQKSESFFSGYSHSDN